MASSLIDIWVSCEGLFIGVEQQWADTRTIRAHCTSVPFLSDMVRYIGSTSLIEAWLNVFRPLEEVMTGCIQYREK